MPTTQTPAPDQSLSRETLRSFWYKLPPGTPRAELEDMHTRLTAHVAQNPDHHFARYMLAWIGYDLREHEQCAEAS